MSRFKVGDRVVRKYDTMSIEECGEVMRDGREYPGLSGLEICVVKWDGTDAGWEYKVTLLPMPPC